MIYYQQNGNYFEYKGFGFNVISPTLEDLKRQMKLYYKIDILTILN